MCLVNYSVVYQFFKARFTTRLSRRWRSVRSERRGSLTLLGLVCGNWVRGNKTREACGIYERAGMLNNCRAFWDLPYSFFFFLSRVWGFEQFFSAK